MTITLPTEMGATFRSAVEVGDYASSIKVIHEALRDSKAKRAVQMSEMQSLKADIDQDLADLAEGRVKEFDAARFIARGSVTPPPPGARPRAAQIRR